MSGIFVPKGLGHEPEDEDEDEDDWERRTPNAERQTPNAERLAVKELEKEAGYRYVEGQLIPQPPGNLFQSCTGKPYVLGDGSI